GGVGDVSSWLSGVVVVAVGGAGTASAISWRGTLWGGDASLQEPVGGGEDERKSKNGGAGEDDHRPGWQVEFIAEEHAGHGRHCAESGGPKDHVRQAIADQICG